MVHFSLSCKARNRLYEIIVILFEFEFELYMANFLCSNKSSK